MGCGSLDTKDNPEMRNHNRKNNNTKKSYIRKDSYEYKSNIKQYNENNCDFNDNFKEYVSETERDLSIRFKNKILNILTLSNQRYEDSEQKKQGNNMLLLSQENPGKKGKKKKKKNLRKKLEELKKREEDLKNEEKIIQEKENKFKEFKEKHSKEKSELDEKKKLFNIEKEKKEKSLNKREKELKQREEKLKIEEEKYTRKNKPILIGLNNIGATCYMNASLQCLSNTKKLTEYFLTNYEDNRNKIMSHQYYKLIKHLWNEENNNISYSPNSFKEVLSKENPLFAGIAANDAKDLINFLIERLHQELNIALKNNSVDNYIQIDQTNEAAVFNDFTKDFNTNFNSPISRCFYGILETKSQCQGCKIIKYNFQVYSFLEFPLQQVNQYYFNNGKRPLLTNDGKNPDVDLYECFEYNRKIDSMTGDNQMYCNICNKLCDATYVTYLYSTPNYLILNLNRGKGAVYECKVNFPEKLNIFNFVTSKQATTAYELYAVICHLGPSSMDGHFVAYCRNRLDNKWYLYNDGFVTLCTRKDQYTDGMPYILFYRVLTDDD